MNSMLFTAVFLAAFLNAPSAHAKVLTFTREYTYQASEADSKLSCRAIALEQTKRLLLEQLGTYLESQTEVRNFQLTKEQITSWTAGITSTEVKEEKWDGQAYWLRAQIIANPEEVTKSVDAMRRDRARSMDLEAAHNKAEAAFQEIEDLKKEIALLKKPLDTEQLRKYSIAVKTLSATDWFEKGYVLYKAKNYREAISAYNMSIELDPGNATAYFNRGIAYFESGNFQQAVQNYDAATERHHHYAAAYLNRGNAYSALGKKTEAIRDYADAIELNPQDADAYRNRGIVLLSVKDATNACADFTKACELGDCEMADKAKQKKVCP